MGSLSRHWMVSERPISLRNSMDVRKRMEVVPFLFDHYIMSSDQKRGQIRRVTMVNGIKMRALFHICFQCEARFCKLANVAAFPNVAPMP